MRSDSWQRFAWRLGLSIVLMSGTGAAWAQTPAAPPKDDVPAFKCGPGMIPEPEHWGVCRQPDRDDPTHRTQQCADGFEPKPVPGSSTFACAPKGAPDYNCPGGRPNPKISGACIPKEDDGDGVSSCAEGYEPLYTKDERLVGCRPKPKPAPAVIVEDESARQKRWDGESETNLKSYAKSCTQNPHDTRSAWGCQAVDAMCASEKWKGSAVCKKRAVERTGWGATGLGFTRADAKSAHQCHVNLKFLAGAGYKVGPKEVNMTCLEQATASRVAKNQPPIESCMSKLSAMKGRSPTDKTSKTFDDSDAFESCTQQSVGDVVENAAEFEKFQSCMIGLFEPRGQFNRAVACSSKSLRDSTIVACLENHQNQKGQPRKHAFLDLVVLCQNHAAESSFDELDLLKRPSPQPSKEQCLKSMANKLIGGRPGTAWQDIQGMCNDPDSDLRALSGDPEFQACIRDLRVGYPKTTIQACASNGLRSSGAVKCVNSAAAGTESDAPRSVYDSIASCRSGGAGDAVAPKAKQDGEGAVNAN